MGRWACLDYAMDLVPDSALEEFTSLEEAGEEDLRAVSKQIGREPEGKIFVAARCPRRRPAVILTVPIDASRERLIPPLWLCCPHLCRLAGELESESLISAISSVLEENESVRSAFLEEEKRFSRISSDLYSVHLGAETASRLWERGIAWGSMGRVKCLHAHMAYFVAVNGFDALYREGKEAEGRELDSAGSPHAGGSGNPPGAGRPRAGVVCRLLLDRLRERGTIVCEETPQACIN